MKKGDRFGRINLRRQTMDRSMRWKHMCKLECVGDERVASVPAMDLAWAEEDEDGRDR
jgi:hypothetical protein